MDDDRFARQREVFHNSTFLQHLGAELGSLSEGKAEIRLPARPEFANRNGTVHGGVLATLVDAATSQAIRTVIGAELSTASVEFKVNFLAPARQGVLVGRGEVLQIGGSLATASATIFCDDTVVAFGVGTLRIFRTPA